MRAFIYFRKESNGNVAIVKVNTNEIIYSLQPNQNVTQDVASIDNIIIKSAVSNPKDRGIVINCSNINPELCIPEFQTFSQGDDEENRTPYDNNTGLRDNYIKNLTNFFFFKPVTITTTTPDGNIDGGIII